ncbi:MAG: hypothetical protein NZO58_07120 [Gemmataceae bacterium]|nr:hypothetical protein [Gemmataceae bacterium]
MTIAREAHGRYWRHLGSVVLLGVCGCAAMWEEVTSREFTVKDLFHRPDPLVVLRDSTDYQRKAAALARLKEPLAHGGTQEQQNLYLEILSRAALNESPNQPEPMSREPLCRLSAIRTLGEYKDPRAVEILERAYLDNQPFTPEINALIRQQALVSLERTGNKEARHVLIRAARQPAASPTSSQVERQQVLDEKLAAIRGLAKFPYADTVDTLVYLLETEKDVAIRHSVHESLKAATRKNLPPDAAAWRNMLAGEPAPTSPNVIQRVTGLVSRGEAKKD